MDASIFLGVAELRESGLVESNHSFVEGIAPMFAKDSFYWSAEPSSNTKLYLNNDRR